MNLVETLVIIFVAICGHYIGEYLKHSPEYSCPTYCEADHGHLYKGIDTTAVKLRDERLFEIIKQNILKVDTLSTISMNDNTIVFIKIPKSH